MVKDIPENHKPVISNRTPRLLPQPTHILPVPGINADIVSLRLEHRRQHAPPTACRQCRNTQVRAPNSVDIVAALDFLDRECVSAVVVPVVVAVAVILRGILGGDGGFFCGPYDVGASDGGVVTLVDHVVGVAEVGGHVDGFDADVDCGSRNRFEVSMVYWLWIRGPPSEVRNGEDGMYLVSID
jgi:hypothetical protein